MNVGVAEGGARLWWIVDRWIMERTSRGDQYSVPRAGWVRVDEMNMQMEERKVEDANKSSCGASPLPHPTHSNSYSCSELKTSQECSLPTAQPHPRFPQEFQDLG